MKKHIIWPLLFLLLLLVACGGAAEEVEQAPAEDVESVEEPAMEEEAPMEEEAAEESMEEEAGEEPPEAIGSEDDSGALPPPINSGSKVTATGAAISETAVIDILFIIQFSEDTAVTISELETSWEDTIQQINALPMQPEARFATILLQENGSDILHSNDFTTAPSWDEVIEGIATPIANTNSLADAASQLSWQESAQQIVFMITTQSLIDVDLALIAETAVYYPIITQEWVTTEDDLLHYETIMESTNGRLILLDDSEQTTLSEQIILAVAETLTPQNE